MSTPVLSIVVPAFNEAAYLPRHLPTVLESLKRWQEMSGQQGEIIVVDNASTDATAEVAKDLGARVVHEQTRNIGKVRNTGADAAQGRYLFFIDADVTIPVEAVPAVVRVLESGQHVGGAIPPHYAPMRLGARILCWYWDSYRRRHRGAQGVDQFCTAEAFHQLGGYRTDWFMSEDVEFFARLRQLGDLLRRPVALVDDLHVEPSTRRYDEWPTWRMVWWQNPLTARLKPTSSAFWRHWYQSTVR
ncbi:glycosyltransferase [Streptomyces sp. B8F3]|uniref:glycosyltransferase n=1 Tax=unclassified Streptomyces TaxID=2593676 RepID=UPI00325DD5D7